MGWKLAALVVLVALCFAPNCFNPLVIGLQKYHEYARELSAAPKKDYPWHGLTNIWTEDEAVKLLSMVQGLGTFSTFKEDITSVKVAHPEAQPIDPVTKGCTHPYLMLNANATECVFPERIDVARHFLTYGGWSSRKENYDKLTSRLQGFQKMFHTADPQSAKIPEFETLFQSQQYLDAASSSCHGKNVFDPIQLGVILQVPGQEVPMHYDVPWFLGATRFTLPQWLLVAMEQSDLFEDIRIPQIQGVAYLHRWDPIDSQNGGGFFFYPKGNNEEPVLYPAGFNNAIVLDGAVVVHGTEPFRSHLSSTLPFIDKSFKHELTFQNETGDWVMNKVNRDGTRTSLNTYNTTDLRISLVWRARCFASQVELQQWHNVTEHLTLDSVISTFVDDLRARSLIPKDSVPEPLDLALLILNQYVDYPVLEKNPIKQHNFCLLPSLYPSLAPLIDLVCK